jgi:hypothetical protein
MRAGVKIASLIQIVADKRRQYSGKENLYLEGTIDTYVDGFVELIENMHLSVNTAFKLLDLA